MSGHGIGFWTPAKIERLRELWGTPAEWLQAGGPPTSSIVMAKLFGTTKSAVLGKAHRLGLPARPSPLLPTRASRGLPPIVASRPAPPVLAPPPSLAEPPPPAVPATVFRAPHAGPCQWPLWGNGPTPKEPRFCGAPVTTPPSGRASSWCAAHYDVCFPRHVPALASARARDE